MILTEKSYSPLIIAGLHQPALLPVETDLALLNAARTMNKEALVRIFDLYSASLYNYALRLCQDSLVADHIVGDVFARFLDQLSAGRGPETNLRSYLYQMTYHLVVDEVRYAGRRASMDNLDLDRHEEPPSQTVEKQMTFAFIMNAIRTVLTDDQRHVIILRFLEGMSVKETAEILGKREDHVKVIQNRAIKALRNRLIV